MALGKRKPAQQPLFVNTARLNVRSHPFHEAVNKVLDAHHFDTFVASAESAAVRRLNQKHDSATGC